MTKFTSDSKLIIIQGYNSKAISQTENAKQAPVEEKVEVLEARIRQLEMENDYLKKLNTLVQNKEKSPKKTKRK